MGLGVVAEGEPGVTLELGNIGQGDDFRELVNIFVGDKDTSNMSSLEDMLIYLKISTSN